MIFSFEAKSKPKLEEFDEKVKPQPKEASNAGSTSNFN